MATKVNIISNAFILLGKIPINSLDLKNPTHVAASNLYDLILPDLISKCPWRSAIANKTLDRVNQEPNNKEKWRYIFQLPTDPKMIVLYDVFPTMDYEIFENFLYCNQTEVKVDYLFVPTPDNFPAFFETLMVFAETYLLANQVTQNSGLVQFWFGRFAKQRAEAMSISMSQIPSKYIKRDEVYQAHYV